MDYVDVSYSLLVQKETMCFWKIPMAGISFEIYFCNFQKSIHTREHDSLPNKLYLIKIGVNQTIYKCNTHPILVHPPPNPTLLAPCTPPAPHPSDPYLFQTNSLLLKDVKVSNLNLLLIASIV